jgi:2-amino-4-hydroxy-6-hydroxymethyldihydropteridine diphosphokinase
VSEQGIRQVHRAYIGLGSNINGEYNMQAAVWLLARQCRLLAVSPVYQTRPVGKLDQPDFVNAVALVGTELSAPALKTRVLASIEDQLQRTRTEDKNAPRTIDLDILLFDDQILELGKRHIPDPEIVQQPHVAVPLADLAPQYSHPKTGQTLAEIAGQMPRHGLVPRPDIVFCSRRDQECVT